MASPSSGILGLPPGVSEQIALETVHRFAPQLRFHTSERHFPTDPQDFKIRARFRESRPGSDRGWHPRRRAWEDGDGRGPDYLDADWNDIRDESLKRFPDTVHFPPLARNLRPRDDRNLEGGTNGLFLQRDGALSDRESGTNPAAPGAPRPPVLVDTDYDPDLSVVRVLYWFFYDLNWWKIFITHEGDWEHVTYVFTPEAFQAHQPPLWVYFAQHDSGFFLEFSSLTLVAGTHPVIYVDPDGHPCRHVVSHPARYTRHWLPAREDMRFVPTAAWRDFAGAWGEVGISTHTTGPLGPFYKRLGDKVPITFRNGKPYVPLRVP